MLAVRAVIAFAALDQLRSLEDRGTLLPGSIDLLLTGGQSCKLLRKS
jgi:hypothetical protein